MSNTAISETQAKSIDELLIDMVRVNPLLFEKGKRIKPYESLKEKSELWKSIATSLKLEPKYCIARWKQLRDRYRREIDRRHTQDKQNKQSQNVDDWPLMERMSFLDKYISQHHHHSHKLPERSQHVSNAASNKAIAQQIFGGVHYDEPLQEAMDEQPLLPKRNIALATTSTQNESTTTTVNPVLVRIEALLGGLDEVNRNVAEKRILSYLCRCQLKALDGQSIEDVQF